MASILMPVVLLVAACGCSRQSSTSPAEKMLAVIDSLLTVRPDSALRLVEMFPDSLLRTSRDTALFRLMRAEARYKNFIDDTSEVEISVAARHFVESGDRRNAMHSLFAQGCILRNAGESGAALTCLFDAKEFADTAGEHLYLGKIYTSISEIYSVIGDGPQETDYAARAYKEYLQTDSMPFIQESKLWLSATLCNSGMVDRGMTLASEVYSYARKMRSPLLIRDALSHMANAALWNNEYGVSKFYYDELISQYGDEEPPLRDLELYLHALIYSEATVDSVERVASIIGNIYGKEFLSYEYHRNHGDFRQAFNVLNEDYDKLNRRHTERMFNETNKYVSDNIESKKHKAEKELELVKERQRSGIVIGILIIVIILILVYYFNLKKTNKISELALLLTKANKATVDIDKRFSKVKATPLLATLFSKIDSCYCQYVKAGDSPEQKMSALTDMSSVLSKMGKDKNFLNELEAWINSIDGDILTDVYSSLKRVTQDQQRLVAFLYFRLSTDIICLLLSIAPNALYNRRKRLFEHLEKSSSPRKDELLSKIKSSENKY